MAYFLKEPHAQNDDTRTRIGILLINLGTPSAPTPKAVRAYLGEFLSDTRVIEIPRLLWWFILNGVILPIRAKQSAKKYAAIWQEESSPLLYHTHLQTEHLNAYLATHGHSDIIIDYAMRYGHPSIESVIARMRAHHVDRLLAVPLYPQYAASSSGSALDQVFRVLMKIRNMPEIRTVRHFYDHPGYIKALALSVTEYWTHHGRPDKLVISFHGLPKFTQRLGDPYHKECQRTGQLLANAIGLSSDEYCITFQSRFGKTEWLKPYTSDVLSMLGRTPIRTVHVICPGFVSDCLETLEEIAIEGKQTFLSNGGQDYHFIPCLNQHPLWIEALANIVENQLSGWIA